MGTSENPVWLGEYVWEETSFDGSEPKTGPLPDEVLGMFRPQHCLLCNIKTANMHVAYAHYESKGHFKKVAHYMKFNYNAIGNLKSKEGKFEPVTCELCNIELLTRMVYLQHYEGKQHAKNLKKKALNTPINVFPVENSAPISVEPAADLGDTGEESLKPLPPPPPLPKLGDYVCALCDVTTATRAQMEMHNNGARHLRNVSKLAEGELREFYMRNGNCEPVETGSGDPTSTTTAAATPGPSQAAPYPQNPGYMPMNQPMMPQYPQMPYGSYPYPMSYDYNAWCQMYGQQYAAYYSQYGQYPYNPYGQQYASQPPYNPGQQGQPPYNPGQQGQPPYNPGQQGQPPYSSEQQPQPPYNAGQQAQPPYSAGPQGLPPYNPEQQYPANSVPPGNNYPENQDPNAWSGDTAQYCGNAESTSADSETKADSPPVPSNEEKAEESDVPGHSENDGVIDSTIFRKYSANRRTVRTPPKASEARVSPLPEGVDKKPLAVLPSVPRNDEEKDERGPNIGFYNGIDAEGSNGKPQTAENSKTVESTQHPSCMVSSPSQEPECSQKLSVEVEPSNEAARALQSIRTRSPSKECDPGESASNEEKEECTKTTDDSTGTSSETQVICLDSDVLPEMAANPKEPTWRSKSPSIPLLGEIPAGIQISDKLVSDYDDLPSIATQDPFPFNQINSNEPPPPGCSVETKLPTKSEEPIDIAEDEAEPQNHPTATDATAAADAPPPLPPPPPLAPASSYYPAPPGEPPESVTPYYSAPIHSAPPYYPAPPNGAAYNYTPTVSAPPSTYNYSSSQYQVHQPPNYSAPVPYMTPTPNYSVPAASVQISTNYSVPVSSMPAVSNHSAQPTSSPTMSMYSAPPTTNPQTQLFSAPQNSKPRPPQPPANYSDHANVPVPTPPAEPPNETIPDPPPPDLSAPPAEPEAETSQESSTPDKTVPAKPKLSSFFARAAVKMIKEKKSQQEFSQSGPSNQGDELKKPEDLVLPIKGKTISIPTIKGTSLESGSTTEDIVASGFGAEKEALLSSPVTKSDNESASRNKSLERKKKKSSRKSRSRSRSSSRSSRTPRRHRRHRSSSRSLSPDRSPRRYDDHRRFGGFRGGYGYGRRGRGFYRYRGNFRNRNDWDRDDSYSRYDRYERNDRDEFGRERSWKRDERDKRRRSHRRRSRSRSSSASPPRVEDVGYWEMKTRAPTPPSPENEGSEPQPDNREMSKKVGNVILDESKLFVAANPVMEKMKEKISFELDKDEIVLSKTQETLQKESPNSSAGNTKKEDSPLGMNSDEEEREKREILEKVALIKRKLMETQDEDEKPHKTKKRKKDKAKKKKKRKKRSSSSSSDSSSDSSLSSTSTSSSSSSETSTSSEPKSKRLVDALMAQLSGESEDKSTSHRRLSKRSRKASKREPSKKKKKKDKKRKKEKKKRKEEPESLSTYITSNGLYHCKYCNFTSVAGGSFLEHLISEEHKLLLKLIKSKVNQ